MIEQKKLLIVVATAQELAPFYQTYGLADQSFVQTAAFDILITGAGMVATAFAMGRLKAHDYALAINVGIAGAFDRSFTLGHLVNVTEDRLAELGAEDHAHFIVMEDLGFGKSQFKATAKLDQENGIGSLKPAKAITVNKVHGNADSIQKVLNLFSPQVESMEGAAFFYACEQLQIPSLQVRSISNYVEPRNSNAWQIGLAVKNLNDWLVQYVKVFSGSPTVGVK